MYNVEISPAAQKQIKRLPKSDQAKILKPIAKLQAEPRPSGVVKLTEGDGLYRVRQGDWRVVYTIEDEKLVVLILRVVNRREAYR